METFKRIIYATLISIALLFIISFFLPSKMVVDRSVTINAPIEEVFKQVNDFKNWDNWSPWHQMDTSMEITYFGKESGLGSGYEWSSTNEKIGSGKAEIINSVANDSIVVKLYLKDSPALNRFKLSQTDSGIVLSWCYTSEIGYNPFARFTVSIAEGIVAKKIDYGLQLLKENLKTTPKFSCKKVELLERNYVSVKVTCLNSDIKKEMGQAYTNLMVFIEQSNVEMIGYPLCFYHNYDVQSTTFEAAIPISKKIEGSDDIMVKTLPKGDYVTTAYNGSYDKIQVAYQALTQWMTDNKIEAQGMPFDEYVTNPAEEKDTTKWITNIYYPL